MQLVELIMIIIIISLSLSIVCYLSSAISGEVSILSFFFLQENKENDFYVVIVQSVFLTNKNEIKRKKKRNRHLAFRSFIVRLTHMRSRTRM